MDYKQTVKAGYDKIAKRYLEDRTLDTQDVRLLDELIARLPENAKVLDAGCGSGLPVAKILSERFDVTGVDFSEAQIELAGKTVPGANFICEDMTKLDFPGETFDAICSYYAIIHVPREEHRPLLASFHRMLKPGGFGLFCLGAGDSEEAIEEDFLGARMYWSHFDADTYLKLLREIGFTILWSKIVADETCEGAGHLFVLLQKS